MIYLSKMVIFHSYVNQMEKYEFVNGIGILRYMKWKIIHSCSNQTTNQLYIPLIAKKSPFLVGYSPRIISEQWLAGNPPGSSMDFPLQ